MQVISRSRGQGKTTDLVKFVKENDKALLVVYSQRERNRIAAEHRLDDNRILTFDDVLTGHRLAGRADYVLVLDNVDMLLNRIIRGPIAIVSISEE